MSPTNKKKLDLLRIKLDKLDNDLLKLIKKRSLNLDKDYTSSLSDSVNYFLNICFKKKYFKKKDFNCSIKSNKLILQN